MSQKDEILAQLKAKQKLMIVSDDQEQLETLFDELCVAGFRNMTMPLFEEELSKRELQRDLGQCLTDIHKTIKPLGKNILEVSRVIQENDGEQIVCELPYVEQLTQEQVEELANVLAEYEEAVKTLEGEYAQESWNGIALDIDRDEIMQEIEVQFPKLIRTLAELKEFEMQLKPLCNDEFLTFTWKNLEVFISILEKTLRLQKVPVDWIYQSDLERLLDESRNNLKECMQYMHIRNDISKKYDPALFELDGKQVTAALLDGIGKLTSMLRIHGQNDGFILDNLRHIAERTDVLLGNLQLLLHDVCLITELTGCEKASTFQNVPSFYQMADFLAHKPVGMKGTLNFSQIKSVSEGIRKLKLTYQTVSELQRQLQFRYQDRFLELDSRFWMEQFGEHAEIKKYMLGQKQLHIQDIQVFIREMEQGEALIRSSWEAYCQFDMSEFHFPQVTCVMDIDSALSICKAILGDVIPCDSWLDARKREHILLEIEDCEQRCLQIQRITYQLMENHNEQIFRINYEELMPKFKEDYQGFFKRLKGSYKQDRDLILQTYRIQPAKLTDDAIVRVLETLRILQEQREMFRQKKAFLVENIGTYYHGENTNWGLLKADIRQFEEIVIYFDSAEAAFASIHTAKESMEILQQYYGTLMTLRNAVRERATVFYASSEFEMMQIVEIADRFERMMKQAKKMERDTTDISTYLKNAGEEASGTEVSYQEILHGIQSLDKLNRDRTWLKEKELELAGMFGEDFKGQDTDFKMLLERLNGMKDMYASIETGMRGDKLVEFLEDDTRTFSEEELSVQDFRAILAKSETELKSFLQVTSLEQLQLQDAVTQLEQIKEMCMHMDDVFAKVSSLRIRREHAKNILDDMRQFAKMQSIEEKFAEGNAMEKEKFGQLYQGVVTDWNTIGDMLTLAKSMRSDVGKYHLSRDFVEAVLDSEYAGLDIYSYINVLTGASIYKNEFAFARSLFEPAMKLEEMEFDKLHEKLDNCFHSMDKMQSWLVYEQGKKKCIKHGLMSFLSAVEGRHLEAEKIKQSFIETFYTKWMESVVFEKGGLHPFRVKSYEEIEEIRLLESEKRDLRTMEVKDYLLYVPHWLSRRKACVLVKDNTLFAPFYEKIALMTD